jgi:TonB family protein
MSDKNKNIASFLTDIFRYNRKELSDRERNSLEREFQKDPFASEAAEGFESISDTEAFRDISELESRLKTRTNRNKRIIFYRIAASVAVLALLSALYLYIGNNRNINQLADNTIKINTPEAIKGPQVPSEPKKDINEVGPHNESAKKASQAVAKKENNGDIKEIQESVIIDNLEVGAVSPSSRVVDKSLEVPLTNKQVFSPVSATAARKSPAEYKTKGKIISAEDNLPVPGANVLIKGTKSGVVTDSGGNFSLTLPDSAGSTLIADFIGMQSKEFVAKPDKEVEIRLDPSGASLNEVVVVGYGTRREKSDLENDAIIHTSPSPEKGRPEFDKYVQKNLHRPDSLTSGQRVVVVLNFTVRKDGTIDNIKIVRSPGKQFSEEAIRVLKAGPAWQPATENSNPVDEEIRLRFVFR